MNVITNNTLPKQNLQQLPANVLSFRAQTKTVKKENDVDRYISEQKKIEKERKNQKIKNNIMTGLSAASALAIIGFFVMTFFGKGGMNSLRSKTEQEALKIKSINLNEIKERAKDTYSEEVQKFVEELKSLLKRNDIEAKGGKRVVQVQLAGPGGTGKTDVAGIIAKTVNEIFPGSEYYIPDLSMLTSSSWKGQDVQMLTEYTNAIVKRIKELNAETLKDGKKRYVIMFLDEYDKIAMVDNGYNKHASNATTGALKTLINELMKYDNTILLSATNYPELIEDAVGSRLSKKVFVNYLNPKQTLTTIVEHYKNNAKEGTVASELLDVNNEKLKNICNIISKPECEMEFRKLLNSILPSTLVKSSENGKVELKNLVEALIGDSIARELHLTSDDIINLKNIVGLT